ncbi:MAG: SHOCT domain-containing protein [Clostridia bacterium]|nr:SHOCT domain-containing protein [Clostridia bacterium]
MEQFILEEDEFELFKSTAKLIVNKKEIDTEVHLTTKRISLIIIRTVFWVKKTEIENHEINSVKIYNELPQVKQNNNVVDIYFKDSERRLKFATKKEAKLFVSEALKFLTGKSKFARVVDKAKEVIKDVDETLNIDTVGIAKKAATFSAKKAGKAIGSALTKKVIGSNKETMKIGGGVFKKRETKTLALTPDEQVNAVRNLKTLFNEGAITEEEFTKKKKEIMEL